MVIGKLGYELGNARINTWNLPFDTIAQSILDTR